jgi:hypothetical protein
LGKDATKFPSHELFDVVELADGTKRWDKVGVGFTNKDASLTLIVDDPTREQAKIRLQMREAHAATHRRRA